MKFLEQPPKTFQQWKDIVDKPFDFPRESREWYYKEYSKYCEYWRKTGKERL